MAANVTDCQPTRSPSMMEASPRRGAPPTACRVLDRNQPNVVADGRAKLLLKRLGRRPRDRVERPVPREHPLRHERVDVGMEVRVRAEGLDRRHDARRRVPQGRSAAA